MDDDPTELVIIGHPRGGTPLMQDGQTAGIDLPLKAIAAGLERVTGEAAGG